MRAALVTTWIVLAAGASVACLGVWTADDTRKAQDSIWSGDIMESATQAAGRLAVTPPSMEVASVSDQPGCRDHWHLGATFKPDLAAGAGFRLTVLGRSAPPQRNFLLDTQGAFTAGCVQQVLLSPADTLALRDALETSGAHVTHLAEAARIHGELATVTPAGSTGQVATRPSDGP